MRERILVIGGGGDVVQAIKTATKYSREGVRHLTPVPNAFLEIELMLKNADLSTLILFCGTNNECISLNDALRACIIISQRPEKDRPKIILVVSKEESHWFRRFNHCISSIIYSELPDDQKEDLIMSHFREPVGCEAL